MIVKLFEVRDRGTLVPAIAVRLTHSSEEERYLLRRAGYSAEQIDPEIPHVERYVLFGSLLGGQRFEYDPFSQPNRTMHRAHLHIIENWLNLVSGDVIDVEFIHGETAEAKISERITGARI